MMSTIGKLSKQTGVKIPTIRYYEEIGLLPEAERNGGNQRIYGRASQERLAFIKHSRDLGFPLDDIRELLGLADQPDHSCQAADSIARRQLASVKARLQRLTALKDELERMLVQCEQGTIAECRVIEVLGNHDLCRHEHSPETGTIADLPR